MANNCDKLPRSALENWRQFVQDVKDRKVMDRQRAE